MSEQHKPSEGAMRAAMVYFNPAPATSTVVLELARVIDRETGLPDLLDACRELLGVVAVQNGNLHADTNEIQERARAALSKATRKPAEAHGED